MVRKIIQIDEEKCNGCGVCANACHEGAIGIVDGKAKLLRDDYCDGMGDCLPTCPTGAISFVERENLAYDEAAVNENKAKKANDEMLHAGCAASRVMQFNRSESSISNVNFNINNSCQESQLSQWPVQIKLLPVNAGYFNNAKLLVAADCTAYAYANFHQEFIKGKITLIGCPKLDSIDYSEKLTEIFSLNDIKSVTVVRMEVPCCGGIEMAVKKALQDSGKMIPWQVITISTDGKILE